MKSINARSVKKQLSTSFMEGHAILHTQFQKNRIKGATKMENRVSKRSLNCTSPVATAIKVLAFCFAMAVNVGCAPGAATQYFHSKVWPMGDEGAAWMIENLPNSESIGCLMDKNAPKNPSPSYSAVVEVPEYVELFSNALEYEKKMAKPKVEKITRDGRSYCRYRFAPQSSFFMHWMPKPTDKDRKDPGVFAWHFETPDGAEPEQTLAIKLLPELPDVKPPKRMTVMLWTSAIMNAEPAKFERVLAMLSRSGFNLIGQWNVSLETMRQADPAAKGVRIKGEQSGMAGWPDMTKLGPAPDYVNADNHGNSIKGYDGYNIQDFQWIIDTKGAPWKNDLDWWRGYAKNYDFLSQDIEWGVREFNQGFSPAGIKAFAKKNSLDASKLTPQIIWKDYRKQWYDFRAEQHLTCLKLYYKVLKEVNPKAPLAFCPGAPYTTTDENMMSGMIPVEKDSQGRMIYAIIGYPWDRLQEVCDQVWPMWYGHGPAQVRQNFTLSKAISPRIKVSLLAINLAQGREYYYTGGDSGETLRAMAWAAILGGAKGWGGWVCEFSPLQLSWLARTWREIGQVEDVFFDGTPDPASVTVTPLPKNNLTIKRGSEKVTFPVPDFPKAAIVRSYALGNQRLVGIIDIDLGEDVYCRVQVKALPQGKYRVFDITDSRQICPDDKRDTFLTEELAAGLVTSAAANFGVRVLYIVPATDPFPAKGLSPMAAGDTEKDYRNYRVPDVESGVLADRGKMVIRYDIMAGEKTVLIESPSQQVWVRTENGGKISGWKIKKGTRAIVDSAFLQPNDGAAKDLFWSPPQAQWTGDEKAAYEVVSAKVHGGKAWLKLRHVTKEASLNGLVVTKTIVMPEEGTDVRVDVEVSNPGPQPQAGFSYWAHNIFHIGPEKAPGNNPAEAPEIYLQTANGVTRAPFTEIVWAKPGQAYITGNENFEKNARNGVTTDNWIAQRNPRKNETVLCQVEFPAVAEFYSWRNASELDQVSVEWIYPYTELDAGKSWHTSYNLRYFNSVEPQVFPKKLLLKVN
jgi:hypothetical protein